MIKIFFTDEQIIKYLKQKGYIILNKEEKIKSIEQARNIRSKNIQEKIKQAIEELKKQGKDINPYSISKQAGINYRTAKKYLSFF